MRTGIIAAGLLVLSGCGGFQSTQSAATEDMSPAALHLRSLQSLCNGEAYHGTLVSTDAVDAAFGASEIIMGPAVCVDHTVRIPLAVGDDRSRTWVISAAAVSHRLKHDHRHKDGTEDVLTQYGGDSLDRGTEMRQEYSVDADTRALFTREGIAVSTQNIWAIEIRPGTQFAYEMSRPERLFRIEFDITMPVPAPPLPWGVEPVE